MVYSQKIVLLTIVILESGQLRHENYGNNEDLHWKIKSDCENVEIKSIMFDIEHDYDFLTIDGQRYTGSEAIVQQVASSFLVYFSSDSSVTAPGFILTWNCI